MTTQTTAKPRCAECSGELIAGLNTDFCSQDCEEIWTAAHTWPCERCDDEGMVDDFVDGHRTRETCTQCHGDLSYVDFERRRCDWDGCTGEAQAGQDFCGNHLAVIHGVTEGTRHAP